MITYEINNGSIIEVETLENATIKVSVGEEKQLNLISETETEKVYQWQRFNIDEGKYEDDTENNTEVVIDGKKYVPKEGKTVVYKMSDKQRIQELELALADEYENRLKMEDKMNQIQVAMTELYEGKV